MYYSLRCCAALAVFSVLAHAQTTQSTNPAPELRHLDAWVGKWNCEGVSNARNVKYGLTMQCEWFTGGFHLECRLQSNRQRVAIYGYSSEEKAYTLYSYRSDGQEPWTSVAKGQRSGTTVTFDLDSLFDGKPVKTQNTLTAEPPSKLSYQWRRSVAGGPWTVTSEGSCKKE